MIWEHVLQSHNWSPSIHCSPSYTTSICSGASIGNVLPLSFVPSIRVLHFASWEYLLGSPTLAMAAVEPGPCPELNADCVQLLNAESK